MPWMNWELNTNNAHLNCKTILFHKQLVIMQMSATYYSSQQENIKTFLENNSNLSVGTQYR